MDFTTWWVFYKKNGEKGWQLVAAVLLLITGWQVGRTMSPYYASNEIVFNECTDQEGVSAGGSEEELVQLRDEGLEKQQAELAKDKPAVAGSSANSGEVRGMFVGSINSNKFHHTNCSTWKRIKESNQIWFASQEEAEAAGYIPTICTAEIIGE